MSKIITSNTANQDWIPIIIILGQSNAGGNAEPGRIPNTQFNYNGIAAGYLNPRTTQPQYIANPAGLWIYYKYAPGSANQSLDVAKWQKYNASITGRIEGPGFGSALSLGTSIMDYCNRECFIIQPTWGGTALIEGTTSNPPGTWNNTTRQIALEYYIQRAARDLRLFRPRKQLRVVNVAWWQGENDAINGQTKSAYKAAFASLKSYIDNGIVSEFGPKQYEWNIVSLKYNENAAEAVINDALAEIAAENADCNLVNQSTYPQKDALTSQEASPVPVGQGVIGSGGDDGHSSYITQLAIGELIFNNIQSTGILG